MRWIMLHDAWSRRNGDLPAAAWWRSRLMACHGNGTVHGGLLKYGMRHEVHAAVLWPVPTPAVCAVSCGHVMHVEAAARRFAEVPWHRGAVKKHAGECCDITMMVI
mmetsp:Transcript_14517/g.31585  ORF Transcript_14517/g.31585 Transcript_14517/m.31585 type:complete len:106 (-) Transcript_14517:533-850(-)